MGFITRCLKSTLLKGMLLAVCLGGAQAQTSVEANAAEVTQLRGVKSDEALHLSANIKFDLPPSVEEALQKGVPMVFVAEAEIYKDRWYWYDKRVANATRTMRLAYQPLTRHWRLNVVSGAVSSAGLRMALGQNYNTLPEAMRAIRYLARWKIGEATDISPDVKHHLQFRFWLDLSQLPRPFQIGATGEKGWSIAAEYNRRLEIELPKELKEEVKETAQ